MILYMYGGSSLHPDGRDPAGSCGDTGKDCGVREKGFIKRDYNKFNKINF
nr:MAG TPA: hypothetical protein [Caudoviricetes sp.]